MKILNFFGSSPAAESKELAAFLSGFSIEVMPKTLAKIDDFAGLLPKGTRVYVAHIEGTPIDDMVATTRRLTEDGFNAMPHVPARWIDSRATLDTWVRRYAEEGGARQALVLAGGARKVTGDFDSSMSLLETGLFDKYGFDRLHVAGHPEGNREIDPDDSNRIVDDAVRWKQDFADRTDAKMAMVTQFVFDAKPVIEWEQRLRKAGIRLPVHVGVAGPAKLQTLLKFAVACGVGPSYAVLQKRAKDVTKLVKPFEPSDVLAQIAEYRARTPDTLVESAHIFPLGGIRQASEYARGMTSPEAKA